MSKYNYTMFFFLRPKGTYKGRSNARHFWQVVGGLRKLYFINNSSPRDKLCTACTTTNMEELFFIKNSWSLECSSKEKIALNNEDLELFMNPAMFPWVHGWPSIYNRFFC